MPPLHVQDIISSVRIAEFSEEPTFFQDDHAREYGLDVTFDGQYIWLISQPNGFDDGVRISLTLTDDKLQKFNHEMTSSLLMGPETDVPIFEIMGLNDPIEPYQRLTPDYYCQETESIGELGTVMWGNETTMLKAFRVKFFKYEEAMLKAGLKRRYAFIVSPDSVMTNFPITQVQVSILCARMRAAVNASATIETLLGYSPFRNNDDNTTFAKMGLIMKSISSKPRKQMEDFNDDLVFCAKDDPSAEMIEEANDMLQDIWRKTSSTKPTKPLSYLENWLMEAQDSSTTHISSKRIVPFPIILRKFTDEEVDPVPMNIIDIEKYLPNGLKEYWSAATSLGKTQIEDEPEVNMVLSQMVNEIDIERHARRRAERVYIGHLSEVSKLYNAKSGFHYPELDEHPEVKKHKADNKKQVSMLSDTSDIDTFIESNQLLETEFTNYSHDSMELLRQGKDLAGFPETAVNALTIYENYISQTRLSALGNYITDLMIELSFCITTQTRPNTALCKYVPRHKMWIIAINSGSIIKASFCFDKSMTLNLCKGKIGPKLFQTSRHLYSDWCIFSKETIEHYMKAQSVLESCLSHELALHSIDVTQDIKQQVEQIPKFNVKINYLALMFLANKRDSETLVTCGRYFYMNILDVTGKDVYKHVDNFPKVIRSRFTVHLLKKFIRVMKYYEHENVGVEGEGPTVNHKNLVDWRTNLETSLDVMVDSFYIGYLSSKERATSAHSSFKICDKLFKEEYKYRSQLQKGILPFSNLSTASPHTANRSLFCFFMLTFRGIMKKTIGPEYKKLIKDSFYYRLSRFTFSDASTLKATGRLGINELPAEILDDFSGNEKNFRQTEKDLREKAKSIFESRKKVLEGINNLVDEYVQAGNDMPEDFYDLLEYSLDSLEKMDGIDSDLFAKSQHEKDREVHVLVPKGRVVQSAIEMLSRVICEKFVSETITHPDEKIKFVKNHYRKAGFTFSKFVTLCKSADASVWCQGHHAARFAAFLIAITDDELHGMIYRILSLWVRKRVTLPASLITNFLANQKLDYAQEMWLKMRQDCLNRKGPFEGMKMATANIRSGMFQGILHYTSSAYHTFVQEVMVDLERAIFFSQTDLQMIVTKRQGSDDSASMNSFPLTGNNLHIVDTARRIMDYKEDVSEMLGIRNSRKTAMCVPFVIEYNSEWYNKTKSIKPTFRWVSACSTLTVNETFIDRYRQFNNLLTSVLESGGTTLECSLIQLSQATLHYKLMGSSSNVYFKLFKEHMIKYPDPTLGFFPLSPDVVCGALGFDYDLYRVASRSEFGCALVNIISNNEQQLIKYEGQTSDKKKSILRNNKFSFIETKIWQSICKRMSLMSKEDIIKEIEEDPELIFSIKKDWVSQRINIALKMYSSGVRASFNNRTPLFKMACAAGYMMNRKFIRSSSSSTTESLLMTLYKTEQSLIGLTYTPEERLNSLKSSFPMYQQYLRYDDDIQDINSGMTVLDAELTHRSRVVLTVLETPLPGNFSLMEICKRKWFGKKYNLPLGESSFAAIWDEAKNNYPFVCDTLQETKEYLGLNTIDVKLILEGIYHKTRKIKMQDTQSKSGSVMSGLLRAYWPGVRVIYLNSRSNIYADQLLSNMFMICAGPFISSWQNEQVTQLLKDSEFLSNCPFNGSILHKLHIMREALLGVNPAIIVEKLKATKIGTIGYFSVRQDRIGEQYSGIGEWRGLIGSTSVLLKFDDSTLTQLVVSSLVDPEFLAKSLRQLMTDIGVDFYDPKPSNCNVTYTKVGSLRNSHTVQDGIGITLDREFKMDILEQANRGTFFIRTVEYGIRLVLSTASGKEFTLLNVPMPRSYWIKESPSILSDEFFKLLHSDTQITFESVILKLPYIKKQVRGHISGKKLETILRRQLFLEIEAIEEASVDVIEKDLMMTSSISEDALKDFIKRTVYSTGQVLDEQIAVWSDDLDNNAISLAASLVKLDSNEFLGDQTVNNYGFGLPVGINSMKFLLSYKKGYDIFVAKKLLEGEDVGSINNDTALVWSFILGKTIQGTVQTAARLPSLSAISGAMSESELINNINQIRSADLQDMIVMRDQILKMHENMLQATLRNKERINNEMNPIDKILMNANIAIAGEEKVKYARAIRSCKESLSGEDIDIEEIMGIISLTSGWDMDTFENTSLILCSKFDIVINGDKLAEIDNRDEDTKEDDPDGFYRVVLWIHGREWGLKCLEEGNEVPYWKYPDC